MLNEKDLKRYWVKVEIPADWDVTVDGAERRGYRAGVEALRERLAGSAETDEDVKWVNHHAAMVLGPKPNAETRQALEDVAAGRVTTYDNVESFFKAIEEER